MGTAETAKKKERTYKGMSAAERRSGRRDQLLEAGLELFGTRGFVNSSVKAVCQKAGLTERYFYEHFDNRGDLLLAVFDHCAQQLIAETVAATVAAEDEFQARIEAGLSAFFGGLEKDPRRARIVLVEAVGVTPELEIARRAVIRQLTEFIAEISEALAPDPIDPLTARLGSLAVVGATYEFAFEWVLGSIDVTRDELLAHLSNVYLAVARASAEKSAR